MSNEQDRAVRRWQIWHADSGTWQEISASRLREGDVVRWFEDALTDDKRYRVSREPAIDVVEIDDAGKNVGTERGISL